MDREIESKLAAVLTQLKAWSTPGIDEASLDPVLKIMLVALLYETQKIEDRLASLPERIASRFCEDFVPRKNVSAMPAIAVLEPTFMKEKMEDCVVVDHNSRFVYHTNERGIILSFVPLFRNLAVPVDRAYWLTKNCFSSRDMSKKMSVQQMQCNVLWLGLNTAAEIDCLNGFSILFRNTRGVFPVRISASDGVRDLSFATMNEFEDIEMVDPFDAQQTSRTMFSFFQEWKEALLGLKEEALVYITDSVKDRDLFKPGNYPSVFQYCFLTEEIENIQKGTLWLKVEFPDGFCIPEDCQVILNAFPVVNVNVDHVVLTSSNPIAKLQKSENSFFLEVLGPSNKSRKDGFDIEEDEYLIRDFDASCYHDGDLYRDVRTLYHHFVEDYYAFIEYHGIRDGEAIMQLRETLNRIGKSVGTLNQKFLFDSGVYAMRNINHNPQPSTTRVSYMTTQGRLGNQPKGGEVMENKKTPGFNKEVSIVVSACCGRDKATSDQRYEQLRYYTLTQDRLYTKMDIDAFLRKEIMAEFGQQEFSRIFIKISVEGAGGEKGLQRGLYVDIEFKDRKNYERAVTNSFATRMQQAIVGRSCLSMPVSVELVNLEKQ